MQRLENVIAPQQQADQAQNNLLGVSFLVFSGLLVAPFFLRLRMQDSTLKSLALAAQVSINGIVHLDRHHRVVWLNDRFLSMFGTQRDIAVGMGLRQILETQVQGNEGLEQLDQAFLSAVETHVRLRLDSIDGPSRWFKVRIQPVLNNKQITGHVLIISDITEELTLHEAILDREAKLRLTVENAQLGTWRWDIATDRFEANDIFARMLGHETRQLPSAFAEYRLTVHPDDEYRLRASIAAHLEGQCDEVAVEYRARGNSGQYQWVYMRGRVTAVDEDGEPTELVGVQMDIDFAKQSAARATESEALLKSIFDALVEGVVVQNLEGQIIAANPQAERILGLTTDAAHGKSIADPEWKLVDANGGLITTETHPSTIVSRTGRGVRDVVIKVVRPDGRGRWIAVNAEPILNQANEMTATVASFVDITERRESEDALSRAARYDKLTGLPNRTALLNELQLAINTFIEEGKPYGLLFIDSDRFKMVNDRLGHEAGDQLLIKIAQRVRDVMEISLSRQALANSMAARLGGDEFVVLIRDLAGPEELSFFAQSLTDRSLDPHYIQGHDIVSSASIGMVMADPRYDRAEDVLRDADTAMYEAKVAGKARAVMFDSAMREKITRRLIIEKELRDAIANDQLEIYYQPIVSFETGESKSFEALVRWNHPERGFILPSEFIPVAEETGLIVKLGEWVLRKSFHHLAQWKEMNCLDQVGGVSINLSRSQISMAELPEMLSNLAIEYQVAPEHIILEITESAVMEDEQKAIVHLKKLKAAGFRIGLDDFGTGYSSLSCIQEFPLDEIKIDRSFVVGYKKGSAKANMIDAILTIASGLGLMVVAEGLETLEEYEGLRVAGCHLGQGYGIGKPMPFSEVPQFVNPMVIEPIRKAA